MESPETLLCRYVYDALDRLTGHVPSEQEEVQRFYNIEHLATELQGAVSRTVFQQGAQLLALQQREGGEVNSQLLATDQQRSVLHAIDGTPRQQKAYTPYGHRRTESGLSSLLGFNGERPDPVTGHYLLGNGHRAFNPVLMRFNGPDRLSPFGQGGLNPYAYCLGDPVNRSDPNGRFSILGIAGLLTSVASLGSSSVALLPSLPFMVSKKALFAGAIGRLPAKYSFGAISSVVAGATGVLGAMTGVARVVVGETDPDSTAQEMLTWISLGFGVISLSARLGSWWVARDPKAITALKDFTASRATIKRPGSLELNTGSATSGQYTPSAPAPTGTPTTPVASAPPPSPSGLEGLSKAELFANYRNLQKLHRNAINVASKELDFAAAYIRDARRQLRP